MGLFSSIKKAVKKAAGQVKGVVKKAASQIKKNPIALAPLALLIPGVGPALMAGLSGLGGAAASAATGLAGLVGSGASAVAGLAGSGATGLAGLIGKGATGLYGLGKGAATGLAGLFGGGMQGVGQAGVQYDDLTGDVIGNMNNDGLFQKIMAGLDPSNSFGLNADGLKRGIQTLIQGGDPEAAVPGFNGLLSAIPGGLTSLLGAIGAGTGLLGEGAQDFAMGKPGEFKTHTVDPNYATYQANLLDASGEVGAGYNEFLEANKRAGDVNNPEGMQWMRTARSAIGSNPFHAGLGGREKAMLADRFASRDYSLAGDRYNAAASLQNARMGPYETSKPIVQYNEPTAGFLSQVTPYIGQRYANQTNPARNTAQPSNPNSGMGLSEMYKKIRELTS